MTNDLLCIIVEGWRFLPHSYAIVNQFQLLEMLKYPNLEIFHKDIPYLDENWQPATGLLDATAEAAIKNIPHPSESLEADATLRISVPYNFAPSNTKPTCLFATTEWGILHNEKFRITGAASLREGHNNSDLIIMVESMGDTIPRTSQLDLGVRVSPHPAPDVLSFRFCSCVDNRGSFREPLEGC